MNIGGVHFPEDRIADFCARHGVRRLSVFGSMLRDDFALRATWTCSSSSTPAARPA